MMKTQLVNDAVAQGLWVFSFAFIRNLLFMIGVSVPRLSKIMFLWLFMVLLKGCWSTLISDFNREQLPPRKVTNKKQNLLIWKIINLKYHLEIWLKGTRFRNLKVWFRWYTFLIMKLLKKMCEIIALWSPQLNLPPS